VKQIISELGRFPAVLESGLVNNTAAASR